VKGDLWTALHARSREAHASGAMYRIESEPHYIEDHGVEFVVRLATDFERQLERMPRNAPGNPFLPPEPPLYLGEVSATHYALLNKYHVIESHLLVVTREYVDQDVLLDLADFEALATCLPRREPAIAFYNGGDGSGASQPHKHLQIVTLPLSPRVAVPMATRVTSGAGLPFLHAMAHLAPGDMERPAVLHAAYRDLLAEAGIAALAGAGGERQSAPYNLLLAGEWMLLVPRSQPAFGCVAINALAFAGAMFVRYEEQLAAVRALGPMAVLVQAALPVSGASIPS
jgi:ATP adenylyltransferase